MLALGAEILEHLLDVVAAEERGSAPWWPEVGDPPPGREEQDPVAQLDAGDAVGDDDHGASVVGERRAGSP